ncbi:MAG: Xanthine and CO dehydrogenases maturation factor, XdhC/CoxF family [uncultured Chloroflexi bacterium]|uniref:Xanthine and CO dehydrogenases maturation factor, XdhC/CoxF family n=1 Tax=uncultured Chloroflexota bacterium TaxID=166587 RepID=A0A6J4K527_9CHLR|nr:MAG: Xanthine and CO dehydrogenases maturation factor, XdhC/CoxF family [uncultured Chloroflexota bacterium]
MLPADDLTSHALDLLERRVPFCQATVVAAGDAASADVGQKLIVPYAGAPMGVIGDDALTQTVAAVAAEQLLAGDVRLVQFHTGGNDGAAGDRRARRAGELEAGAVEVALEPMPPPDQLIIVGAGHIAQPLARIAGVVGFEVTVIDDRERFANRERFPDAAHVVVDAFDHAIAAQQITPWTYLVLVTRGHEHDEPVLQHVAASPAPYIGMIGSRRRVLLVFERLRARGVPDHFVERIFAPIGLDIGARTPEEIALAIMAEIVNVKRGGKASSLTHLLRRV